MANDDKKPAELSPQEMTLYSNLRESLLSSPPVAQAMSDYEIANFDTAQKIERLKNPNDPKAPTLPEDDFSKSLRGIVTRELQNRGVDPNGRIGKPLINDIFRTAQSDMTNVMIRKEVDSIKPQIAKQLEAAESTVYASVKGGKNASDVDLSALKTTIEKIEKKHGFPVHSNVNELVAGYYENAAQVQGEGRFRDEQMQISSPQDHSPADPTPAPLKSTTQTTTGTAPTRGKTS